MPDKERELQLRFWQGDPVGLLDDLKLRGSEYRLTSVRTFAELALAVPSSISVQSERDLFGFLRECRYASDSELFGKKDYWQAPDEFERTRAGDCEDHALWAWRKSVDLGQDARFTLGEMSGKLHAWVTVFDRGAPYILETTAKETLGLIDVSRRPAYAPSVSIDRVLRLYRHLR